MVRATVTVDDYDAVVAAYERLGFSRVKAWNGTGRSRSALFRAGPAAAVEVIERPATMLVERSPEPREAAAA